MVIADVVKGIFDGAVKPVLDKIIPDAQVRLEAELMYYKQAHEVNLGQLAVNKEEAGNQSVFVSGWRPFVGWVCGAGFAYAVIGNDVLNWILRIIGGFTGHDIPVLGKPEMGQMFELLVGMLGMGAYRTYEKINGVASK
jgi:hypothetical protein